MKKTRQAFSCLTGLLRLVNYVAEADDMTEEIFEKIVEMLLATFGIIAPAATATTFCVTA